MIGATLHGRYRIEAELGRGGMGVVYRARDVLLDRPVAVKLLNQAGLGPEGRARLLREAQAAARLDHSNIVAVYDAGESDGAPYIVMQLVEGRSLHERQPQAIEQIVAIARQICAALGHAHAHGIVHRDLKPENVVLTPSGVVKLMDFGLARSAATRLTVDAPAALVGSVFYLAPEQALGREVDGRADLYALGVVLYELLTGRLPFTADDPLAVISQHLYAPVVPPRALRSGLPPALDELIVRLMAKQPADRPASAEEVAAALAEALRPGDGAELAAAGSLLQALARGRLVGRAAEVAQLRAMWAQAQQGRGRLVLLSGEPGVGKTRLANEIQVAARLGGAAVLRGGCYEYEAATPYLPFAEALRRWVREQDGDSLQRLAGPLAPELARLAPEIESRLGPLAPNPPLPPAEERLRLFDHLARFLRALAAERGLLLFLDDLHWADQGTLSLLHYLLRHLRDERVLALAAYREVELDRAHPLAAALVEWNRERLADRLALGRLSLADTAALLATLLGQESVSPDFAQAMFRETEGNPFFIEEVVKSLVEQGQIYRDAQRGGWNRKAVADLAIPQSIKEAIGRRLDRLSRGCVDTLHAAAALGKVFSFGELAAVAPAESEEALLNALDEACTAQLLQAGGGEEFAFTHDKIREVLYEELNPIRRRRLHGRVAEALARLYAADLEAHVEDLAHHSAEAGDLASSLAYSLRAAAKAAALFSLDEALDYYAQAREAAEALNLPERLAAVHEGRGDIYAWRGRLQEAVEAYQSALALASAPEARAVLKSKIGAAYTNAGAPEGYEYLQSALAELNPQTQPEALALATSTLGRHYHLQGQHQKAVETFEQALQLAEPLDDPFTLTNLYGFLAGAYQHLAQYDRSLDWARRCIAYGERRAYPLAVAGGHEFIAEDYVMLGRWAEALEHAQIDLRLGQDHGMPDRVAWAEFSRAHAFWGSGGLRAAVAAGRAARALAQSIGDLRLNVLMGAVLSICLTDLGDLDLARALAAEALAEAERSSQLYLITETSLALAYLHLRLAEWENAHAPLERCQAAIAATDNRLVRLRLGAYRAESLLGLGRLAEAESQAAAAVALGNEVGSGHYAGLAGLAHGRVLAAQGRADAALQSFAPAIRAFETLGSRLELARALRERGLLRGAQGRPDEARADWSRALDLFEACGAAPEAAQARTLLAALPAGG